MNVARIYKLLTVDDLRSNTKADLPVSIVSRSSNDHLVVSRYGDEIWDFYPYFPQDNLKSGEKIIKWDITLPDGLRLTAPKHLSLLESAKDFMWSLFSDPIEGRKRPTMATLVARFDVLQPLLRWMVSRDIRQFRGLEGHTIAYISSARINQSTGAAVSPSTHHYRLLIIECIYAQRNKIKDALLCHPWPHESSMSLSGMDRSSAFRKPTTEAIPYEIAVKLLHAAISYIDNQYPSIKNAVNLCAAAGEDFTQNQKQERARARTKVARSLGLSGTHELTKSVSNVRTACYIIIDMFSGIRDSEMMSLDSDCISTVYSADDGTTVNWLRGTIYKTGVRPKKWIVPDIVVRAVNVLADLTNSIRRELNESIPVLESRLALTTAWQEKSVLTKRLHLALRQRNKLFLCLDKTRSRNINVISGHMLNASLKLFCRRNDIVDTENKPYQLHAHQFRRTYAKFLARAELGDLLMLQEHFGHASMDMSVHYVEGSSDDFQVDAELLSMVSEEKKSRQHEVVKDYLLDDRPLANGTHWLKEWRTIVRTSPNKETLIADYAGALTLNGTGHSWCVGNSKGNGCGGLCVFEAKMCVDCHYGIIGEEHRSVWTGIRDQQLEVLSLDDVGPGGKARATQILEKAEKVLKRLDGGKL